ncbi:MAG: hypothetical protein GWO87_00830 [Xanthomonadaceae bacterium]|nr:hypothetical protein [Rhodospirillaceae bacterium]NIA17718.1 hypothetical protein [Xanthomonadaceae bacterium]
MKKVFLISLIFLLFSNASNALLEPEKYYEGSLPEDRFDLCSNIKYKPASGVAFNRGYYCDSGLKDITYLLNKKDGRSILLNKYNNRNAIFFYPGIISDDVKLEITLDNSGTLKNNTALIKVFGKENKYDYYFNKELIRKVVGDESKISFEVNSYLDSGNKDFLIFIDSPEGHIKIDSIKLINQKQILPKHNQDSQNIAFFIIIALGLAVFISAIFGFIILSKENK